jgi:hypothetical protein
VVATPAPAPVIISAPPASEPATAKYYLAPNGSDSNPGTLAAPFKTLMKLWTVLSPGDLVYLRGGEYVFTVQQYLVGKNGTASAPIKIYAYPGETPVLTRGSTWNRPGNQWHRSGIFFSGNFFHFKGLEIKGFFQYDEQVESGLLAYDSNDNVFEQLNVHHNGHGFYVEGNSSRNLLLNSDSHHNYDKITNGGNSDGISFAYTTGTDNVIRGCRAWWNSDDGFDTFEHQGHITIENSWSWNNGYVPDTFTAAGNGVGFKLGSVFISGSALRNTITRTVRNSIAFSNRDYGMHINEGETRAELYNNTMYGNAIGGMNFHYMNLVHIFKNNVSFGNDNSQVEISSNSQSTTNAAGTGVNDGGWAVKASVDDFVSVNSAGVDGPRQANGDLPVLDFLRLKAGSDLINAGTNVGQSFKGTAPDLGAFEAQ